jgi:hypothetical protein
MLSKNVLIFCAPRTGSTILANYIAQCLDGQVITGDYGIDVAAQDKSLVVKMEDTFLIPDPIKEFFPTFDPRGWTLIKLKRIDEVDHILSLCQRTINYNYSEHNYKEFTIDKETLFITALMIRSCHKQVDALDPTPFTYCHEINFEDLQDWPKVCQKLGIPYSETLNNYPAKNKWKYVLNRDEVEVWLEEFYNLFDS